MSTGEALLSIEPRELQFPFELEKQISCFLRLTNRTNNHVAFKVKTTNPKNYIVLPNIGVVLPHSTCEVIVTMKAEKEAPPNMKCRDKFLLQSVVVASPGATLPELFHKESGNQVEECKLEVRYLVLPPFEGSDDDSSSLFDLEMERWEHLKIPFAQIQDATNNFQEQIGSYGYSRIYKGELFIDRKYTKVAVKRISKQFGEGVTEFMTEVQLLVSHKHVNLISLVAFCIDGKELIIAYKYPEHGSLNSYISGSNTDYILTWLERLKIVVDVARGLDHLHNRVGVHQAIIHRDIKCSNIFLDDNLVAKISNFGLSILCFYASSESTVVSAPCGTPGYMEPEYTKSGLVSKKSDVYSFGLVLLEVLCGRICHVKYNDGLSISTEVARELYENKNMDMIIDPSLKKQASPESLSKYSDIAYKCLKRREDRPLIEYVKRELEQVLIFEMQHEEIGKLKGISISFEEDHEHLKEKRPSIRRFSVAEIDRAINESAHKKPLGEGSFGKVYRGNISGQEVAIKRMNIKVERGIEMFQKEIDLLSSCDQDNIISLVGYCDEGDKKILVYEYMPNGSLYDYLFSHQDVTSRLTVVQRLEICIGVAKGLRYLHSGSEYNIIHSDFKTDNILLDGNLIPKISDFGLSRTRDVGPSTSQIVTNHIQGTEGYLAPECYEPNYKLSRKADVYAFGVVLLEVLCERQPWKRLVLLALRFIMRGELNLLTPQHVETTISRECLRECENLIWHCLENDPDKRPVMSEVVDRLEYALKVQKQN